MAASSLVLRKSEEDGVELLLLRNPPVNALSTALLEELDHALQGLPATTRCLLLTGDGTYFSAGADLKEMGRLDLAEAPRLLRKVQGIFRRLAEAPFPSIAALNGLTVGGGLELALACDLRVAGESAKLGAPETSFGLMPAYGGTQRLARIVGRSKAMELVFTANLLTAAEALRIGLVNRVVPSGQELRAARDLAHGIAQRAPRAVAAAKRAMRLGLERPLEEGLAIELGEFEREVLPSEDLLEGISAFSERRPPKFQGK
ncbi:MAG: enoyl-CoA hydratase-related protein [Thermoplasmata archaeon]|nr:enoyl-CoA hydratase-related protein [Thermoplasmata archaeon]